ncbi:MAG TPA: cytochrome-c peroxidase [Cytophagales bacterium]|nr:cytochrome-c peroxidase [Cytophagales bacterium]
MFSCLEDDGDEVPETPIFGEGSFSTEELNALQQTLNLQATPFNYANVTLPEHYLETEALEVDNTPANNAIKDMGATLGRVLFYDKNLSANNTISCASCHQQNAGFSDPDKLSRGLNGETTRRNSMSLINSRFYEAERFLWDERAATLEEQVLLPIQDHIEMGMDLAELEAKLQGLDYYPILFTHAFGTPEISSDRIAKSLSQFVRSIVSTDSKFDRALKDAGVTFVDEDVPKLTLLSEQENLGREIFYNGYKGATCSYCHGGAMNVNDEAKNNGLDLVYSDNGKGEITGRDSDMALFKVPALRNVALTAPYMHDGRFATLMEVVNHYSDNVQQHPNINFRLTTLDVEDTHGPVMRLNLTRSEKEALVAFLHTLTDDTITTEEKWSDPFKN